MTNPDSINLFPVLDLLRNVGARSTDALLPLSVLLLAHTAAHYRPVFQALGAEIDPQAERLRDGQTPELVQLQQHLSKVEALHLFTTHTDAAMMGRLSTNDLLAASARVGQLVAQHARRAPGLPGLLQIGQALTELLEQGDRTDSGTFSSTPDSLAALQAELLDVQPGMRLLDASFGLGLTALTIARRLRQQGQDPNSVRFDGQEITMQVAILAEIHLFLNGVTSHRLHSGDTLARPATEGAVYDRVYGDPPFGMIYQHAEAINNDPRFIYTAGSKVRSAEWLFIQHGLHALKPGGRATFVTVNGPLFRGGPEAKARAALTEAGWLSAAVSLPSALYPYTALPVALMVFERPGGEFTGHDHVLFVDAGALGSRAGRLQALSGAVQARIAAAVAGRTDEAAFSRNVSVSEILTGDAVWQPSRYVTALQVDAPDLEALRSELVKANEALLATQKRVEGSFARLRELLVAQGG